MYARFNCSSMPLTLYGFICEPVTEIIGQNCNKSSIIARSFARVLPARVETLTDSATHFRVRSGAKSKTKQILVYGGTLKKPYYHKVKNVPKHCGCIEADARYCKVYDMLGIFFIPIKINFHLRCNVMPKPKKPDKLDKNDIFSVVGYKPKSGGGYSESYDLRAYQSGDSLKNIHWKLSSKLDEVIIKEPAQPIYRQLIINAVFSDNCDENDDILARMSYVCRYIINKNEVCYCSFNGINASEIINLDELERYFYAIYTGIGFNECSVDKNCIYYSILPKNEEVSTL